MARLLVADNSPFYRKLLTEALEERGHQVLAVGDGLEALQALAEEHPDAVVLDLVMPKVNGARACRQIKARPETCSIPVVILSGLREDEIDDPDEIGADAYVAKMQAEQMLENLSATLDELLAGKLRKPKRGFDTMHRREVVSELLEERRSQDAILSSLREGYLRLAEDGRIIEANPAALEMLAIGEADIVNRPVAEILTCSPGFLESFAPAMMNTHLTSTLLVAPVDSVTRYESGGPIHAAGAAFPLVVLRPGVGLEGNFLFSCFSSFFGYFF